MCVIIHFWKTEFYSNNVNPWELTFFYITHRMTIDNIYRYLCTYGFYNIPLTNTQSIWYKRLNDQLRDTVLSKLAETTILIMAEILLH